MKTLSFLSIPAVAISLALLVAGTSNAQTGCHAVFGFAASADSLTIAFTDASTSSNTITSWSWDFGDGHTSTEQNPSHTYAHNGTYAICLTIHDDHGCSATACHQVSVHGITTATCEASFHIAVDGLLIHFTDASIGSNTITSWSWDFGDGHTSTEQNPSHTYAHNGSYAICLTIHDDHGCSATACHQVSVHHGHPVDHPVSVIPELFIHPNPFSVATTLEYTLSSDGHVLIEIHDPTGQRLVQLVDAERSAGPQVEWLAAGKLKPGVYVITLTTGGDTAVSRIVVSAH